MGRGHGGPHGDRQALADGPTGEAQPVVGGRAGRVAGREHARRVALVGDDGVFGEQGADDLAHRIGGEGAGWKLGPDRGLQGRGIGGGTDGVGQRGQRGAGVAVGTGQHVDRAAVGHEVARLVGIGEERHG